MQFFVAQRRARGASKDEVLADFNASYWEARFALRREHAPGFIAPHAERALIAGKYLAVVRECGEDVRCPFEQPIACVVALDGFCVSVCGVGSFVLADPAERATTIPLLVVGKPPTLGIRHCLTFIFKKNTALRAAGTAARRPRPARRAARSS